MIAPAPSPQLACQEGRRVINRWITVAGGIHHSLSLADFAGSARAYRLATAATPGIRIQPQIARPDFNGFAQLRHMPKAPQHNADGVEFIENLGWYSLKSSMVVVAFTWKRRGSSCLTKLSSSTSCSSSISPTICSSTSSMVTAPEICPYSSPLTPYDCGAFKLVQQAVEPLAFRHHCCGPDAIFHRETLSTVLQH